MSAASHTRLAGRATALGVGLSLALHAALWWMAGSAASAGPELDLEFELPEEIEFGLTEEMAAASGASAPPESAPPASAEDPLAGGPGEGVGLDAGLLDAGVDAGPLVAEAEADPADDVPEEETPAAEIPGEDAEDGEGVEGGEGEGRIPPGAQLALRLDMARVRASPVAGAVRDLLAAIPDWQLILEGSGIQPLEDLDRLMIASPNLQRSRLIMAGRHAHANEDGDGRAYVREVVARFGEARGAPTPWSTRHGVPVAPWPNEDRTERVIAIIGPAHFSITRPEDLQRLLSVARAREEGAGDDEDDEDLEDASGPDALLSMGEEDAATLEIEGARQFLRRGDATIVPVRARAAIRQDGPGHVVLRARAHYESAEEAERAHAFWDAKRAEAAGDWRTQLVGMAGPLRDGTLALEEDALRVEMRLSVPQARLLLGYLEGMVGARRRRPRRPPPPRPDEPPDMAPVTPEP